MMIYRTAEIIAQLRDNADDFQGRVAGTADEAAAKEQKILQTPSAWVFPVSGRGLPNTVAAGGHSQKRTVFFGVMVAVRNVADKTGASGTDILEPLRDVVQQLIVGWAPNDQLAPCDYVLDRGVGYDQAVLRWVDVFSTYYFARKP